MPVIFTIKGFGGGKNQWIDIEIFQYVWNLPGIWYFKIKIKELGIFIFELLCIYFKSH